VRKLLTVGGVLVVIAVAVAAATPVLPRTLRTERRFTGAVIDVVVNVGAGRVTVTGDRASGALLVAHRRYALRRPDLTTAVSDHVLHVTTGCPQPLALGCRTDLDLHISPAASVRVTSGSGSISVRDVAGNVDLRSSAGGLTVAGVTGVTRLRTTAGPVTGSELAAADLTATTSAGDITLSFAVAPDDVQVLTQAGAVDLRLPDDSYRVDAHASTRPVVTVTTDPASSRRVEARSDAGTVRVRGSA